MLRLAVTYLNATIYRKPESLNQRLEPTGLANPAKSRGLMSTDTRLTWEDPAGWVFGRLRIRKQLFSRTEPALLAGYPDPLLTLATDRNSR